MEKESRKGKKWRMRRGKRKRKMTGEKDRKEGKQKRRTKKWKKKTGNWSERIESEKEWCMAREYETQEWQTYLRVTPYGSTERGPLHVVLPTDGALRLWQHSWPSPGTEETYRATTGHIRANYPSETWRKSLSYVSHTHTLRVQNNPIPLVSGEWEFLMNLERF